MHAEARHSVCGSYCFVLCLIAQAEACLSSLGESCSHIMLPQGCRACSTVWFREYDGAMGVWHDVRGGIEFFFLPYNLRAR